MAAVEQGLVAPPDLAQPQGLSQTVRYPRETTVDNRRWEPRPDGVLGICPVLDSVKVIEDPEHGTITKVPVHVLVSFEAYGEYSLGGELPLSGIVSEKPRKG